MTDPIDLDDDTSDNPNADLPDDVRDGDIGASEPEDDGSTHPTEVLP